MPQRTPTGLQAGIVVPDTHAPYHNTRAWSLMMKVARSLKPTWLVHIGDLADFYAVSDHDKDPDRANHFKEEIEVVNGLLDELDSLGAKDKLFIEANHEDRLRRYLMKSPELHGIVTVPKLLQLKERGWSFTPYKSHAKRGKVHFTHDVGVSSRNAIFKSLDLYQHSIITGHTHRLQYVVESNASGDSPRLAASFGWLGDVEQVEYMNLAKARSSWALGFGVGYHEPASGYTFFVPVPILPAKRGLCCMVNGKLYSVAS